VPINSVDFRQNWQENWHENCFINNGAIVLSENGKSKKIKIKKRKANKLEGV
jgi:hypothetical protein